MKKLKMILSVVLAIVILTFVLNTTAYAEDTIADNNSGNTASVTIVSVVPSTYMIYIPETINADADYTFTAASMNIRDNETVLISITNLDNGMLEFADSVSGSTFKKEVIVTSLNNKLTEIPNDCVGLFFGTDISSSVSFRLSQEAFYATGIVRTGEYSTTAEFQISLTSN